MLTVTDRGGPYGVLVTKVLAQVLGLGRGLRQRGRSDQKGELLPAQSGAQVAVSGVVAQAGRHHFQDLIATGATVQIIDLLEVIDIEHHGCQGQGLGVGGSVLASLHVGDNEPMQQREN